ncbi:MAG TPA: flagellar basal body rod C-terminal domain-containing protein [Alphaproteobacteria bacterium]|nr:flagellar basal body rod C-terminal domain-containing protein [Alphaproteobacteria bacterium]
MINPISIALTGMSSASKKADVAASNIANASVVGSTDPNSPNQAYSAKVTSDQNLTSGGVGSGVRTVVLDRIPSFVPSFQPDSPFADSQGLVNAPNVNADEEIVNLKVAENAYKANAEVIRTSKEMQSSLLDALNH